MSYYHPQHFPPVLNNHYGISVKTKRSKKLRNQAHNRRLVLITSIAITLPFAIAIAGSYLVKYSSPSTNNVTAADRASSSSSSFRHSHPELHPTNNDPPPPLHVPGPEVAWLVNYPASRAAFIRKIIHDVSRTTTATNYLREVRLDNTNLDEVPYRFRNDMTLPSKYLLTETHCAGYGLTGIHEHQTIPPPILDTKKPLSDNNNNNNDDAAPRGAMFVRSPHDFYTGCATGETTANQRGVLLYSPHLARKVVHLIRNPLDNIVQRYYSAAHETRLSSGVWRYGESSAGFKRWCRYIDGSTRYKMMLPMDLFAVVRDVVPCYVLLHQYVMFHNNVWDMVTKVDRRLEYSVAHVDDYEYFAEAFIYKLFQFLNLESKGEPPALTLLKYSDFFSEEERVAVSSYIKVLAAEEIWNELKRYLPPPSLQGAFKPLGEVLSPTHHGTWPKRLTWLMALPSAGGDDLAHKVSLATGTTTATNDATLFDVATRPNVAYGENGPYRASSRPFPKAMGSILTSTTCYNHTIPNSDDYMVKSLDEFYADCGVTQYYDTQGKLSQSRYKSNAVVSKIVHLVRNPFDNMVAQFQMEASSQAEIRFPFSSDADGFWSWCDKKNEEFSYWHQSDGDNNNLSKKVPCYALLYQYIQWHNYAFAVAEKLEVDQLVFYYEDLVTEREEKMDALLKFLGLTKLEREDDEVIRMSNKLGEDAAAAAGVGDDAVTKQHHHASSALTGPYKSILDSLTDAKYAATVEYINLIGSVKTNQALERYLTPI